MCHLSRRMQERFEWIRNIFWHYFWKTHLVVIQWYALQWFEHPNNTAATERLTWIEWHWWYNESFHNLFNDLILIIRQNHRGSFSDPILSSGCSCVKPMLALPDPVPNVTFDVVFTSKKECDYFFLVDDSVTKRYHRRTWLCVCFHVFPCFSIFLSFHHVLHIFQIGQHRGVLRVYANFLTPKGVQRYSSMDGLGKVEGGLGAKGMCGKHSFWVLPTRARFEC